MRRRVGSRLDRIAGTAAGMLVGAFLLGIAGAQGAYFEWASVRTALGVVMGAILGGIVGRGYVVGIMSPITVCVGLFAIVSALIAPACDASGVSAAPFGALFGASVGWLMRGSRSRPVKEIADDWSS